MSFPRFYYSFFRLETIDKTYEHHQVIFSQFLYPFLRNMDDLQAGSFRVEKLYRFSFKKSQILKKLCYRW